MSIGGISIDMDDYGIGGISCGEVLVTFAMWLVTVLMAWCVALRTNLGSLASRLYAWWTRWQPSRRAIHVVCNPGVEGPDDEAEEWKITRKWVEAAKCQFGFIRTRSRASEEAVAVWLRKEMKGECVRNKDMLRVIPYAVASVFIASDHEICAEKLFKVAEVKSRNRQMPRSNK